MRQVGLTDLDLAARATICAKGARCQFAADLIEAAHLADKVRKRTGQPVASGGTGSLYAQAAQWPVAPRGLCDAEYLSALSDVISALSAWRSRTDHVS